LSERERVGGGGGVEGIRRAGWPASSSAAAPAGGEAERVATERASGGVVVEARVEEIERGDFFRPETTHFLFCLRNCGGGEFGCGFSHAARVLAGVAAIRRRVPPKSGSRAQIRAIHASAASWLVPMDDGNNSICNFPTATDVLAEILVHWMTEDTGI
jgi:hypothetical protein